MNTENKFPSQLAERFQVRLPDGMRDRIRAEAERNGRSMNTEILELLTFSLERDRTEVARLEQVVEEQNEEIDLFDELLAQLNEQLYYYKQLCDNLKMINSKNEDYTKRLLFHVLNYIEDIPPDLTIWCHDMIRIIERSDKKLVNRGVDNHTLDEVRRMRQAYQSRALEEAKEAVAAFREHADDENASDENI